MTTKNTSPDYIYLELEADEAAFVDREVSRGAYANRAELLRAGLRLLESRERNEKVAQLRLMIDEADADVAAGRFKEFSAPGELTRYIIEQAKTRR